VHLEVAVIYPSSGRQSGCNGRKHSELLEEYDPERVESDLDASKSLRVSSHELGGDARLGQSSGCTQELADAVARTRRRRYIGRIFWIQPRACGCRTNSEATLGWDNLPDASKSLLMPSHELEGDAISVESSGCTQELAGVALSQRRRGDCSGARVQHSSQISAARYSHHLKIGI